MGGRGLEHPALLPSKTAIPQTERAESGAVDGEKAPSDPELALIVDRWPKLPEHIKQAVLALVRTHEDTRGGGGAKS